MSTGARSDMTLSDPNYDNTNARKHAERYREDPVKAHLIYPWNDGRAVTTLFLTTTGNKSGQPRSTPLIYKKVDEGYVVVASLGGSPNNPTWFLNLQASPECTIQVGASCLAARAKITSGAERERLWREAVAQFPEYDIYKARTEREIPVVLLTPVP